jgi:hypothetical protein
MSSHCNKQRFAQRLLAPTGGIGLVRPVRRTGRPAHAASQLRDPPAGGWYRYPDHPGSARTCRAEQHRLLHQGRDPHGAHRHEPARQARPLQAGSDLTRRLSVRASIEVADIIDAEEAVPSCAPGRHHRAEGNEAARLRATWCFPRTPQPSPTSAADRNLRSLRPWPAGSFLGDFRTPAAPETLQTQPFPLRFDFIIRAAGGLARQCQYGDCSLRRW